MTRIVTLWVLLLPGVCWAQAPAVEVSAGHRRLDYAYRFENDSSFDTPFLVPHFFEQKYEVSGWELSAKGRYRLAGHEMTTTVSFAPEVLAFGSDFDTFFQPSGDVATSGTAGDVRLASFGITQTAGVPLSEHASLHIRMSWRRDRADFLPADRVVTHTQPPSETREWITDRERTVSNVFETGLEAQWRRGLLTVAAHGSPVVLARLLVQLPDKYPGRDIRFDALGWTVGGTLSVNKRAGRITPGAWLAGEHSGSYRRSQQYSRNGLSAGVSVGWSR
jgi:hypothetical protein